MQFKVPSQEHNVRTLRTSALAELSGSLGDLGTLIPLMIALTVTGSISLSTTLVFTGLSNIFTGWFFGLPIPVQPMKAIAAVAISNEFTKAETASAGIFVSAVVLVLSITGLLDWIGRTVPIPVVKGIQVGAGLTLVISAGTNQLQHLGWISPKPYDNLIWALGAFILLLATTGIQSEGMAARIPYALVTFSAGIVIALIASLPTSLPAFELWSLPKLLVINWKDFQTGSLVAGLGQLPLTTLNSIIAVTHLSGELLPSQPAPTPRALGLSVAVMNLAGCPFGAMPTCHGSGGMAAQYRFGARSGSSVIVLGLIKLTIGLAVKDRWLVDLLKSFPSALLGIMVLAAGVELAKVGESLNLGAKDLWERIDEHGSISEHPKSPSQQERSERWLVMTITVAGLLAFKNDAVGFMAGLLTHVSLHWRPQLTSISAHGQGQYLAALFRRRRHPSSESLESRSLLENQEGPV